MIKKVLCLDVLIVAIVPLIKYIYNLIYDDSTRHTLHILVETSNSQIIHNNFR